MMPHQATKVSKPLSMSTFEERVQARMADIKFQKEHDHIEIEARRRLNVQKKKAAMAAKADNEASMAARNAVLENERARLEKARAAEIAKAEEEKRIKIMGFNARIRTIQRDIDMCLHSYKKIHSYFKFLPIEPATMTHFNNILYDIKKDHDAHLSLLAIKTQQLREFTNA